MRMMNFDKPIAVAYYRVSTQKQGRSGLGLDAQQAAVETFCGVRGLKLDSAFTEVESGKRTDRTELAKAFAKARRLRGVVVIAKLDRLARDVHFVSGLIKQGVAFACVDAPDDDAMMLHVWRHSPKTKPLRSANARRRRLPRRRHAVRSSAARKTSRMRGGRADRSAGLPMKARAAENRQALRDAVLDARKRGLSLRAIAAEVGAGTMTVSRILKAKDEK